MSNKLNLENLTKQIPEDIKEKTDIEKKIKDLERVEDLNKKNQLLKEVILEIEKIEKDTKISKEDKEKIDELKKNLNAFKDSLGWLKKQIESKNYSQEKIFEVTEKMEKEWLFWQDDEWFFSLIKTIFKWFENKLFSWFGFERPSSLGKISKTFKKLWYCDDVWVIQSVLQAIRKIPLKDIDDKLKTLSEETINLKNNDKSWWEKVFDLPVIRDVIEEFDKFVGADKIDTLKKKKVAIRILKTISLNKDLIKNQWEQAFLSKFITNTENKVFWLHMQDNFVVGNILDKMFIHGISDLFRDYALPAEGVKLINYNQSNLPENKVQEEKIESVGKIYKIWSSKIEIGKDNKFIIYKWGKKYEFLKLEKWIFTISDSDIEKVSFNKEGMKVDVNVGLFDWVKQVSYSELSKLIDQLSPDNTVVEFDWAKIYFKIV